MNPLLTSAWVVSRAAISPRVALWLLIAIVAVPLIVIVCRALTRFLIPRKVQ